MEKGNCCLVFSANFLRTPRFKSQDFDPSVRIVPLRDDPTTACPVLYTGRCAVRAQAIFRALFHGNILSKSTTDPFRNLTSWYVWLADVLTPTPKAEIKSSYQAQVQMGLRHTQSNGTIPSILHMLTVDHVQCTDLYHYVSDELILIPNSALRHTAENQPGADGLLTSRSDLLQLYTMIQILQSL